MLESSDWMEEKEKKEDNKMAISRERARASVVGSIHRRKWVTFSSIYEKSFYHGEKELFTFSIDMES